MPFPLHRFIPVIMNGPNRKQVCINTCRACETACQTALAYIDANPENKLKKLEKPLTDCRSSVGRIIDLLNTGTEIDKSEVRECLNDCEKCRKECEKFSEEITVLNQTAQACGQCIQTVKDYFGLA